MSGKAKGDFKKVTVNGITVKVKEDVMDDMDVMEWLGELQDGNIFVFPKMLKRVFGEEYVQVKKALGSEGVTKASDMTQFFVDVITAVNEEEAKNSLSSQD